MLRPSLQGVHSDQVSFPGGRYEEIDVNLQNTALREAFEEIGIEPQSVEVMGNLTQVYIPVSNSLVQPVAGYTSHQPIFKKNDLEVKK
jgi:8-oxo-dGTP pyrophosphatase MutT (NUDIX family)